MTSKNTETSSTGVGLFLRAAADMVDSVMLSRQAQQVQTQAGSGIKTNKKHKRVIKSKKSPGKKKRFKRRVSKRSIVGGFKKKSTCKKYKRKYKLRNSRRRK